MSALSGISGSDMYSSMYSLLSYGSTARAAASTIQKVQKITSNEGTAASSQASKSGSASSAGRTASSNTVSSFLSMYRNDLLDLEKSAGKLQASNADSVFNQYELGAEDEGIATVKSNGNLTSGREFEINVLNLASEEEDARFEITENGVTTQYSSRTNTIDLEDGNLTVNLRAEGRTQVYTGVDEDKIVGAMKDMVDSYNKAYDTLSRTRTVGSAIENQYQNFNRSAMDSYTMDRLGLSYNKDGTLAMDEKKLRNAIESDYETTRDMIGGQYGVATRLGQRAETALSDSVTRVVDNVATANGLGTSNSGSSANGTAESLSEAYGQSVFQYLTNLGKTGAYSTSNYYTVGLLLNSLA